MQHVIKLADAANTHMVLLTVSELEASQPAIDIVFDLIGAEDTNKLVAANILPAGQLDDLKAVQQIVFDQDAEGLFIRDGITFTVNGVELDPDKPLTTAFKTAERDGQPYKVCDLVVASPAMLAMMRAMQTSRQPVSAASGQPAPALAQAQQKADQSASAGASDPTDEFARIMFLHQVGIGTQIDVTKDFPEIAKEIADCEKNNWVEIDVTKASYKLTEEGKAVLRRYLEEAQDLIKRYDIYCDVDVDASGTARFDTGLGKDMRVAAFEFEGVDPFRARFLLGINDGEWNNLSNWMELIHDRSWYDRVFEPVERAPSVDEIGAAKMQSIVDQGKTSLRQEQESARYNS